jgi:tetratricopeptide (TPR) repeat protein
MHQVTMGPRTSRNPAHRRLAIAAIACICSFVTGTAISQQGNRDYYSATQTSEGAELLKNVEEFHVGPGLERMQGRNYSGARDDFEFILKFFPNHPRGLALISELCDVRWKNPQCDSSQWFERAIARNPNVGQTFVIEGVHLQRLNRVADAITSYKRALALDPTSRNAHYDIGLAYFDQKQFELANRHAQVAYMLGMPFPGLRDKLTKAGKWVPLDRADLQREIGDPAKAGDSSPAPVAPAQ